MIPRSNRAGFHPRLIVNFHGIGVPGRDLENGEDRVWVDVDEMSRILDVLVECDDVLVTSDDGNMSDLHYLAPALEQRGLSCIFFVLAGRIGQDCFLGETDIQQLVEMGFFIGTHGWGHLDWRRVRSDEETREFVDAVVRLQEVSKTLITDAACPFGSYDRRTIAALKRIGMSHIYTSDEGWNHGSELVKARNSVGPTKGAVHVKHLVENPSISIFDQTKRVCKRWR